MSDLTPEERTAIGQRLAEGRRKAREAVSAPPKRPLTWNDLPHDTRKCAKSPGIPDNAPVHQMRCVNCRLSMWTRSSEKENICERCEFVLIDEKHRMRGEREISRGGQFVNPFAETTDSSRQVNPLGGGGTKLL